MFYVGEKNTHAQLLSKKKKLPSATTEKKTPLQKVVTDFNCMCECYIAVINNIN